MSEQNTEFERSVAIREGHKIHSETSYFTPRPQLDFENARHVFGEGFDRGYIAATAEANKRIEALEGEVAELKEKFKSYKEESLNEIVSLNKACYEYKTNINDLREALEYLFKHGLWANTHAKAVIETAITTTPAQSLQSVINETVERCAKVCDEQATEWDSDSQITHLNYAEHCAMVIRALKEGN